jgi:hypothetical protein
MRSFFQKFFRYTAAASDVESYVDYAVSVRKARDSLRRHPRQLTLSLHAQGYASLGADESHVPAPASWVGRIFIQLESFLAAHVQPLLDKYELPDDKRIAQMLSESSLPTLLKEPWKDPIVVPVTVGTGLLLVTFIASRRGSTNQTVANDILKKEKDKKAA